MGLSREDRLHLRLTNVAVVVAAFVLGAALPSGSLNGEAGRLLVTFLGLVAASILPTVTLLLNSMTTNGRSVLSLTDLHNELQAAVNALFFLFGCAAGAAGILTLLALPAPELLLQVPHLQPTLSAIGRGGVVALSALTIMKAGTIPGVIRRTLEIRAEIAVEEAKRKTADNAPEAGAVGAAFKGREGFGRTVRLEDIKTADDKQH